MYKITFKKRYNCYSLTKKRYISWKIYIDGKLYPHYSVKQKDDEFGSYYIIMNNGLYVGLYSHFTKGPVFYSTVFSAKKAIVEYINVQNHI